jgi:hypothetical protein
MTKVLAVSVRASRVQFSVLPSIGDIIFISLLFVLTLSTGQGLLGDGDTGYHIRTGELIFQTWHVPRTDPYSFHEPPLEWTAHEWLSEIAMAAVFVWLGLTGVVVFFAIMLTVTHWLLYQSLRSKSDDIWLCVLITLLATATSASHWLARPHAFSLLFAVVWCQCLDRFQYRNAKTLIYLPILMLLWVNLHGGFMIGLILLAIYLLGNILRKVLGGSKAFDAGVKVKPLAAAFIATLAVCLLNPSGTEILWFPFRLTSDRFIMDRVTEFLSPNFHDFLPFKYMLLATIGALALSRSALNFIEAMLVVLLSYMALYSARHVSLFAIVVAPILLKSLEDVLAGLPERLSRVYQRRVARLLVVEQRVKWHFWPVIGVLLIIAFAATGTINYKFDEKKFPVAAVEFLRQQPVAGNMFNNDEFGDYIIFAAWPAYRVFMDGRSDMYGEKFGSDYLRVANAQPGWKEVLDKYNITWVLFDTNSALTAALVEQRDWHPIYSDKTATLFVKNVSLHAALLQKYASITVYSKPGRTPPH